MADEDGRALGLDDTMIGRAPNPAEQAQSANTISPALERELRSDAAQPPTDRDATRGASDEAICDAAASPTPEQKAKRAQASLEVGDVPKEIAERYFSEKRGSGQTFYPDAQTKDASFMDAGNKLSALRADPNVIADMLKVAEHRGWSTLEVSGTAEFRREVWMQVQKRGLEVSGYKPTERDLQELERWQQGRTLETGGEVRQRDHDPTTREAKSDRQSAEPGVTGKIIELGEAPYQGRKDAELSPFVKLEMEGGQTKTLWGVGLPDAAKRAGAGQGDIVTVKRDGFEQVMKKVLVRDSETGKPVRDKETGRAVYEEKPVNRGMWTVTAETFLNADKETRSTDSSVRAADSQMRVIEGFVNSRTSDPNMRDRLMEGARQEIAKSLAEGTRFTEATVHHVQRRERSIERPVLDRQKQTEPRPEVEKEKPRVQHEAQEGNDMVTTTQKRPVQERRGPERERSR